MTQLTRTVMALVPVDLTTTKGMARHLATLGANQETRPVAVQWFGNLPMEIRMALIESVRTSINHVRELLYLAPDATELMVHLDVSVLRRVCDGMVGFMSAVEPIRCFDLVRATTDDEAKREWLNLIYEAFSNDREKFQAIVDTVHPPELATFFEDLFRFHDLETLAEARHDPGVLENILDQYYPFIAALFDFDPDRYCLFLDHLTLIISQLNERKTRLRTNDELARKYWPSFMHQVKDMPSPELLEDDDVDDEEEDAEGDYD